ncbi:hypothetical protein [Pseudomonas sp. CF161]|uniref:hypothetical protein n=1 Tax=Pseudomonas sp. CF161 TaxID=911241 RepID=UPI0012EC6139|nr:hypothetical protein [Pseudomonas sp. CF161]
MSISLLEFSVNTRLFDDEVQLSTQLSTKPNRLINPTLHAEKKFQVFLMFFAHGFISFNAGALAARR